MAENDVAVDPAALRTNATHFDDLHGIALTAYNRFVQRLDSIGVAWKEDKFGSKFEENYVKPKDNQLQGMDALVESFSHLAEMIRAVAKQHEQAEKIASGG